MKKRYFIEGMEVTEEMANKVAKYNSEILKAVVTGNMPFERLEDIKIITTI